MWAQPLCPRKWWCIISHSLSLSSSHIWIYPRKQINLHMYVYRDTLQKQKIVMHHFTLSLSHRRTFGFIHGNKSEIHTEYHSNHSLAHRCTFSWSPNSTDLYFCPFGFIHRKETTLQMYTAVIHSDKRRTWQRYTWTNVNILSMSPGSYEFLQREFYHNLKHWILKAQDGDDGAGFPSLWRHKLESQARVVFQSNTFQGLKIYSMSGPYDS